MKKGKDKVNPVQMTVAGQNIYYHGDALSLIAEFEIIISSTISTPGAWFFTLGIKNMYFYALFTNPKYL